MKKKLILLLLTLVFLLIPFGTPIKAQEGLSIAPMPPYDGGMPSQPFGQTHAYTVTLRGNQEAVVSMKAIFTNYEEATMSAMTFQIPKGEVETISAYQVVREPQCIRYDYSEQELDVTPEQRMLTKPQNPKCVEYSDPDYYNYYYGKTTYLKADVVLDEGSVIVNLARDIHPQKSGSIVLYYRASGYVKKDTFGAFTYSFETLKSDTTIRTLTVGVNPDSDLYLEGTDQSVNYETTRSAAPMMAVDSGMKQNSFASPEFDSYYQQIGYGRITKTSADLQPYDSFTVEGRYAKSKYQLYGKRITVGSLLGIGLFILIIVLVYKLIKHFTKNTTTDVSSLKNQSKKSVTPITAALMVGASLFSAIFTAGFTVVIYILFMFVETAYYSEFNLFIVLILILLAFIVYPFLIFGSPLFMGLKRGLWWGVGTLLLTFMWLCIFLAIFFMYLFFMQKQRPYPMLYRDSSQSSSEPVQYMK